MPIHDFCVLPVHAGLLAIGGIVAYEHKDSKASLYGSLGTAAILAVCTQLSYKQFKEKKPASQPVTAVSLGVSAAVTAGMLSSCKAIGEHNKLAIAGAVLSTAFTGYYAWNLYKNIKENGCCCAKKA